MRNMGQIGRLKSVGGTSGCFGFTEADKEFLVKIVRYGELLGVSGTKGTWTKFLATVDRAVPENRDPSKRPWNVLASFLETWKEEKALQIVQRARDYVKHQRIVDVLEATESSPDHPEEKLARLTRKHPLYPRDYNFFSYQEEWVRSELVTAKDLITPPTLVGLDCEMVTCEDGSTQLVRVCLVDRDLQTVIDTLVQPSKRVVDYKSHITGVTAEDLESVVVTQKDIQIQVKGTLSPGTIIVGHSLCNDLKALHIDHRRVIDTAYIFHILNRPRMWCPSLRDLCKVVLGYDFREDDKPHDCLEDSKIPLKLVLHCLKDGLKPLNFPDEVDGVVLSKLLIHKVPKDVSFEELKFLFPPSLPFEFQKVERGPSSFSKYYSTYAVFSSKEAADSAFNQLRGFATEDISGRLQKMVQIRSRFQHQNAWRILVTVRKMGMNTQRREEPIDKSEEKLRLDMDFKRSEVPETVEDLNVGGGVGTGEHVLNSKRSRSVEDVKDPPRSPAAKKLKKNRNPLSISSREGDAVEEKVKYREEENEEDERADQVASIGSKQTVVKPAKQKNVPGGRKKSFNKGKKKKNKK